MQKGERTGLLFWLHLHFRSNTRMENADDLPAKMRRSPPLSSEAWQLPARPRPRRQQARVVPRNAGYAAGAGRAAAEPPAAKSNSNRGLQGLGRGKLPSVSAVSNPPLARSFAWTLRGAASLELRVVSPSLVLSVGNSRLIQQCSSSTSLRSRRQCPAPPALSHRSPSVAGRRGGTALRAQPGQGQLAVLRRERRSSGTARSVAAACPLCSAKPRGLAAGLPSHRCHSANRSL